MPDETYESRYVAFIDTLGFRGLIEGSASDEPRAARTIRRVREAFEWALEDLHEERDVGTWRFEVTHFSDSFVMSMPKTRRAFTLFLLWVSTVIDSCMSTGLLVRGTVTFGKLLHDEKLLFGPAMIRAYDLERTLARYPRVIIDPNLAWASKHDSLDFLERDDDGLLYLNYFIHRRLFWDEPLRFMKIYSMLVGLEGRAELRPKADWLRAKLTRAIVAFDAPSFIERLQMRFEDMDAPQLGRREFVRSRRVARLVDRLKQAYAKKA